METQRLKKRFEKGQSQEAEALRDEIDWLKELLKGRDHKIQQLSDKNKHEMEVMKKLNH